MSCDDDQHDAARFRHAGNEGHQDAVSRENRGDSRRSGLAQTEFARRNLHYFGIGSEGNERLFARIGLDADLKCVRFELGDGAQNHFGRLSAAKGHQASERRGNFRFHMRVALQSPPSGSVTPLIFFPSTVPENVIFWPS